MSTELYFLSADVKLTKSFWLENGELRKSTYPNVKAVTSHKEHVTSLKELYTTLKTHAAEGHCLVKGTLHKQLDKESRAGATRSDDHTNWICLDLDGSPYKTPQEFMNAHEVLRNMSYVVQYSASYGLLKEDKLRCHIFMLLDGKVPAPLLKGWLISLNLTQSTNKEAITLSRTGAALHYSIDVTSCQNDKLLYIAPPILHKGVASTLTDSARIQYVIGKQHALSAKHVVPNKSLEQLKKESRELLNALRKANGYNALRTDTRVVGEHEVQAKPGEAVITGMKEDRGFIYFNLNGGDSWGYYHPVENYELIHNFKGEPSYKTSELLPGYYKDKRRETIDKMGQPIEGGLIILAFCEKRTGKYWKGSWNPATQELDLHPAASETQLAHWMQNHSLTPYEVIPVFDLHFDPQDPVIYDDTNMRINTFTPSKWLRAEYKATSLDKAPLIKRIILHAVSGGKEDETFEHFLNWLAVIFQHRRKPKTAWVLHGTEGTGKGLLVSRVLAPLLGKKYVVSKRASELEEKFTSWLETALIAFIDEIKVSASERKDIISSDLRNFITEDDVTIRHMNRVAIQCQNYTGFIFSSNEKDPVVIKSNDRRYNIGTFQPKRIEITQNEIDFGIVKELSAFMAYIMTRSADITLAGKCLHNAAHRAVVDANKTSLDVLSSQIADGDIMELWDSRPDPNLTIEVHGSNSAFAHAYTQLLTREIKHIYAHGSKEPKSVNKTLAQFNDKEISITTAESRLTRDELVIIFEHCVGNMPKTPNKFTSLLKHRGIPTQRMRINGELQYGLEVEWRTETKWLAERVKEFEQSPKLKRVK